MAKKVLIVGANFMNKGAQSMLFIVTAELKKRYHDCEVYFACNGERYEEKNYQFKRLLYTKQSQNLALGENVSHYMNLKQNIKNIAMFFLRGTNDAFKVYDAKKIVSKLDLIIDVSGYALADISKPIEHEYYLDNIRIARKYGIPMILMPQSFGPFNYGQDEKYLINEMKELLPYPKVIYTRENQGFTYLKELFSLDNLKYSSDIVLQNKELDVTNVCTDRYEIKVPELKCGHNVAVIPNYHCFVEEFAERNFELYRKIIKKLLDADKEVYVFRHSSFDLDICKKIVSMFEGGSCVHLIEQEFDCIEYDKFIQNFEFIICSRYHGCVHAYRNYIPNVILGWAVKYKEMAKLLNQERYIFDVLAKDCDDQVILNAVEDMLVNVGEERKVIRNRLATVQKNNCFEVLDEIDW